MKTLNICPTFLCPFACAFCLTKDKTSFIEYLNIQVLDKFLQENSKHFDNIVISGGEPMNFPKDYFDALVDTIKKYNQNISVYTYPFQLNNYREDVEYIVAYEFMARARALDVWENILRFPKKFDMKILLTPTIFKMHPNLIFQKLSLIPNLNSIEFIPYFKNSSTTWNIDNRICNEFLKLVLNTKLNVPFIQVNKEKIRHLIGKISKVNNESNENYYLLPSGDLAIDSFNEYDIHSYKTINISDIDNISLDKFPVDFYSQELLDWSIENGI